MASIIESGLPAQDQHDRSRRDGNPPIEHRRRGTWSLVRRTVAAAGVASAANLAVFGGAKMQWGVPAGFVLLNPLSILLVTAIAAAIAGAGLGALTRLTLRANFVFLIALGGVTILSLAGPGQAMQGAMPGSPRATLATGITMITLHVLTAGVIAALLLRPQKRRR